MPHSSTPIVLDDSIAEFVCSALSVATVEVVERIQSLWGDQGQILRLRTDSNRHPTCVLKHISLDTQAHHPRGWNTSTSFQRKATSYDVERCWYENYADECDVICKVPQLLGTQTQSSDSLILLEDLSSVYPLIRSSLSVGEARVCLEWLAHFHAQFLGNPGHRLWPEGCYWHLSTRADEFAAMPECRVKRAAKKLDAKLAGAQFKTLVHGDAKVANFCFSPTLDSVAGVDFQYVGKGCGIKDVVYFLGSCLTEAECADNESALLELYFTALRNALSDKHSLQIIHDIESEWRSLYGVAWTDFYRFLLGWMPTHQKINSYTLSLCERTLSDL
ncbi:MAG: hypothetical protein ACI9UN_003082 [Granulosicoccus sp.]|jgi:hypothetical protein